MSVNGIALLGMPGVAELIPGEWELLVLTVGEPIGCPKYGVVGAVQDRRVVTVQVPPFGGCR